MNSRRYPRRKQASASSPVGDALANSLRPLIEEVVRDQLTKIAADWLRRNGSLTASDEPTEAEDASDQSDGEPSILQPRTGSRRPSAAAQNGAKSVLNVGVTPATPDTK